MGNAPANIEAPDGDRCRKGYAEIVVFNDGRDCVADFGPERPVFCQYRFDLRVALAV
jgi:hypothetical protein